MQTTLRLDGAGVWIQVDSADEQGHPRDLLDTQVALIGPDLSSTSIKLEQTAAGRYGGIAGVSEPGTYLVQIVQRDAEKQPVAHQTAGLVVPYSPEYTQLGQGSALLNEIARATGGSTLETTQAVFAPTQRPASRARWRRRK